MKTQIFKSYSDFLNRETPDVNGVSEEFAKLYPDFEKQNETNKGCWNCSDCSDCSDCSGCSGCFSCFGCSRCSRCSGCSDCSDCSDCSGCSGCSRCSRCSGCSDCSGCSGCFSCFGCSRCSRCSGCSDCSGCSGCSRCSRCSGCSDLKNVSPVQIGETNNNVLGNIPVIANLHQKVFEAATIPPDALDMSNWHHSCGTKHCRAGWVVTLAGEKGRELEKLTTTPFAAMQIYHASCPDIPVSPVRFYESNEKALADMKRCADLEKESKA